LKQELWPCHKTTPLQLWIDVHLCHVLLRAAVASGSNTESFLIRAFQGFTTCIQGAILLRFVCQNSESQCIFRKSLDALAERRNR
jgi:hypothetical protein